MNSEKMCEIISWLRTQAADRRSNADYRLESAKSIRDATPEELRDSKRLAEKMAGRRLNVSTSKAAVIASAEIDERIARKLIAEADKLSSWADFLDRISAATK